MFTRLLNKLRHPGAHIAPHAHITASTLGPHTIIHPRACLANSTLGPHCEIHPHAEIFNTTLESHNTIHPRVHLTDCNLGAHTYIARETFLNNVRIGRYSSIGPRTLAGTGNHPTNLLSTSPHFYSVQESGLSRPHTGERAFQPADGSAAHRLPITIGSDVWIGAHVFIRDGITIGHGAIIAAGAVVTKNVPPYAIYGGVPAKQIRLRFTPEITARLLALEWWTWPEARLRAARPHLASSDPTALLAFSEIHSHSFASIRS